MDIRRKKKKRKMIKLSSFMYTFECIRPCKGGKRAIAMCNRNKNSVREHSRISTRQDTRQRSIKNISEREKKQNVCVLREKKRRRQQDITSTTEEKRKDSDRQRKSLPP
jgi:hypothetical protein